MSTYTLEIIIPNYDNLDDALKATVYSNLQEIIQKYIGKRDTQTNLRTMQAEIKDYTTRMGF